MTDNVKPPYKTCPVCGYSGAAAYGRDFESWDICQCCGVEFGYGDAGRSHSLLTQSWKDRGCPWYSKRLTPAEGWDAMEQLKAAGLI